MYLRGAFIGGGRLEIRFRANNKADTFLHKVGPFYFNIRGWAFIRSSIFLEICLKNRHFWHPNWGMVLY